jgi:hypothetical protein
MKKLAFTIAILATLSGSAWAQSNNEDISIIQNLIGKEKKDIVAAMVHVDSAATKKFWEVYDEYEVKRKALGKEKIQMIEQYANQYKTLTNEQAEELMNNSLSNNISMDKLQKEYFKKFSKVIGSLQAAQLMQIENYLKNAISLKVLNDVPFINDMIRK